MAVNSGEKVLGPSVRRPGSWPSHARPRCPPRSTSTSKNLRTYPQLPGRSTAKRRFRPEAECSVYPFPWTVTNGPLSYMYVNHTRSLWHSIRVDAIPTLSTRGTSRQGPAPRASVVSKGSTRSRRRVTGPLYRRPVLRKGDAGACLCKPQAVSAPAQGPGPPLWAPTSQARSSKPCRRRPRRTGGECSTLRALVSPEKGTPFSARASAFASCSCRSSSRERSETGVPHPNRRIAPRP